MDLGERPARDDVILSDLSGTAAEVAETVTALNAPQPTWLVEAFYPEATIAYKISFAVKNALIAKGFQVSDRTPSLAAGDVSVLAYMQPASAYPHACRRYAELESLSAQEALLAVVLTDARETILHAGICRNGAWKWLR